MLYTMNTSKSAEDRSTRSIVDVYRSRYADLDLNISELRDLLLNERDVVRTLQDRLERDRVQLVEDLEEEREDFEKAGIDKNDELDKLQDILDDASEELDDIEKGIDTGITCLSSCQSCFSSCYGECQTVQGCLIGESICTSCVAAWGNCYQTCSNSYETSCTGGYSEILSDAQQCSSCYVVSNTPAPCNYTSCDSCVSGYTVSVCTSNNTSTVCTTCVTCQACDGTSNECTATTQQGCWDTMQIGCTACVGVSNQVDPYECESDFKCSAGYTSCRLMFGGDCEGGFRNCNLSYGKITCGSAHSMSICTSNYSLNVCVNKDTDESCVSTYTGCARGYGSCSTTYQVCVEYSVTSSEYEPTICSGSYTWKDDEFECQGGYSSNGVSCQVSYSGNTYSGIASCTGGYSETLSECSERFQICSAGPNTFCTGGFSYCTEVYDPSEKTCDPCWNVNGGCTSECYSCDGGTEAEVCSTGNTTTVCTTCDMGQEKCDVCHGTQYESCVNCVSGGFTEQDLVDLCIEIYGACSSSFANCWNTSGCTQVFSDAAGCEAGEGCGGCQSTCETAAQKCSQCYSSCISGEGCSSNCYQVCNGGNTCTSTCEVNCETDAQKCTSCYTTCETTAEKCGSCYAGWFTCGSEQSSCGQCVGGTISCTAGEIDVWL